MFLAGRPDEFSHPNSSLAYHLHRLLHSAQSVDETEGKSGFVSHIKLIAEATFMVLFHS